MSSHIEKIMARRQVDAEILADPVVIQPYRRVDVPTPDGGHTLGPPTPIEPAQVLIIPAKRRLSSMIVNTELGDVVDYPYIVLGRYFVNLRRDDTFTWNGDKFVVKTISIKTEVSITAQVDYFGGANNG